MPDIRVTTPPAKKPAGAKGAAKKAADQATAQKQAPSSARKPITKKSASPQVDTQSAVTSEERQKMIAEAAYLRAEKRGFVGGDPAEDWLIAEAEIDKILSRT